MKKQQDLHEQKRVRMPSIGRLIETDARPKHEGMSLTVSVCVSPWNMRLFYAQEAELEEFLFAGNAGDISGFGREDEEQNERLAVAELIAKVRGAITVLLATY